MLPDYRGKARVKTPAETEAVVVAEKPGVILNDVGTKVQVARLSSRS